MDPVTSSGGLGAPGAAAPATPARRTSAAVTATEANVPVATAFHDDLTRATERLQPVHGRAYSKVMDGAREGMYVNRSHNARDGQAFAIEHHGGRRWHVYGEGADRVVIAFAKHPAAAPAAAVPVDEAGATTAGGTAGAAPAAGNVTATPVPTPAVPVTSFTPSIGLGGGAEAAADEADEDSGR